MKIPAAAIAIVALLQDVPPWVVPPKAKQPFLEHRTFRSERMGVDVGYNVYLPPGYAENPERRYPCVFWLHGFTCHESNDQFPASMVDAAIREGRVPPMIWVYGNGGSRAFYCDSVDGKILSETMITTELIPFIDKTYRTMGTREGRALQGMSMGGHGALRIAFRHPELFSSVVAFAGGFVDEKQMAERHPDVVLRMFGGDASAFADRTAMAEARKHADAVRGKLPVFVLVGAKDFLLEHNRRMHATLEESKIAHDYVEIDGIEHNLPKLAKAIGERTLEFAAKHFTLPR